LSTQRWRCSCKFGGRRIGPSTIKQTDRVADDAENVPDDKVGDEKPELLAVGPIRRDDYKQEYQATSADDSEEKVDRPVDPVEKAEKVVLFELSDFCATHIKYMS
jgi:hypothetical protein